MAPKDPQPQSLDLFDQMLPALEAETPRAAAGASNPVEPPPATQQSTAPPLPPDAEALALAALPAAEQSADTDTALPPEARRALVTLLRQGVVLRARKKGHFEALQKHESAIRAQLSNLYLELLLDDKSQLAMIKQQEPDAHQEDQEQDDEEIATLIRSRPLTLYDSLVLLVLRRHYQQRETEGASRILIEQEQIEAQLRPFLPLTNSSRSDGRKLSASLEKFDKHKLLISQRGDDSRYEITAVIRYVVNAEMLQALLGEYTELAESLGSSTDTDNKIQADE